MNFLRQAVQITSKDSCGHMFCRHCLFEHTESELPNSHQCPVCRSLIEARHGASFVAVPFIDRSLRDVTVPCTLECGWEGPLRSLEEHNCPNLIVMCENDGCAARFKNRYRDLHLEECLYELETCHICQQKVTRGKLNTAHFGVDCPMEMTTCQFCRMPVRRNEKRDHETNTCPERRVECLLGCGNALTAREETKHNQDALVAHVSMLTSLHVIGKYRVRQWVIARDKNNDLFFGEILALDPFRRCALVSFAGYSSLHDEWVDLGPERMKVFDEHDVQVQNRPKAAFIPINSILGNGRYMTPDIRRAACLLCAGN